MDQFKKLKGLCDKANLFVEIVQPPKYVLPFNMDHTGDIILIRKEGNLPPPFTPMISIKKEAEEELDLTGSPLYTSLDDSLIVQPLGELQANESEYYNHFPLTYAEAMHVINGYSTLGNPNFAEKELPIWILCNAVDNENCVLLFFWRENSGWVTRGKASLISSIPTNQDGFPILEAMLKIHIQTAVVSKSDVSYLIKASYLHDGGTFTNEFDEIGGNSATLKMNFSWKRPYVYFIMPPVDASSSLEMDITLGYEATLLWQEIEALKDISCLMEENAEEKEAQLLMSMTATNVTVMSSPLRTRISLYISTGNLPEMNDHPPPNRIQQNGVLHVHQIYSEVAVERRRSNTDFTEVLWSVLKGCSDIVELNSCFKLIFREAAAGRFVPMILPDNKTVVATVIQGFGSGSFQKPMPPRLKGNESLCLLFELGCLKLQRDYKYIFQRIELHAPQLDQICQRLKHLSFFKSVERKKYMENLVNVHSLLEVLMVLKARFHLDEQSLGAIFISAASILLSSTDIASPKNQLSDCFSPDQNLQRTIYVSLPVHPKLTIPLVKGSIPVFWSVCLSTSKEKRKVKTIFHNSSDIFPSAILDKGDQSINQSHENSESHCVVQLTYLSDYFFPKP